MIFSRKNETKEFIMEPNYNPFESSPENEGSNNKQNFDYRQFQPTPRKTRNLFETASLALAAGALISCTFIYGAYILGALAILFALLSRGGQMKMSTKAKVGLILGIIAILLSTFLTILGIYVAIEMYGSIENALREYCNMYGLDFEEEFGILFEQLK